MRNSYYSFIVTPLTSHINIMIGKGFSPCSITGIFYPVYKDDPLKTGSIGISISIDSGCKSEVIAKESDKTSIKIFVNNNECNCNTTRYAIETLLKKIGLKCEIVIKNYFEVPISQGFATSSSGTISSLIALKEALKLNIDIEKLIDIAHISEVLNNTGLGSVVSQYFGGIVIRRKPGCLKYALIEKYTSDYFVVFFILDDKIPTKKALKNLNLSIGKYLMKNIKYFEKDLYIKLSRKFIFELNVHSKKVLKFLKENEEFTANLFGNVVYTITEEPEKYLNLYDYKYIVSKIFNKGLFEIS